MDIIPSNKKSAPESQRGTIVELHCNEAREASLACSVGGFPKPRTGLKSSCCMNRFLTARRGLSILGVVFMAAAGSGCALDPGRGSIGSDSDASLELVHATHTEYWNSPAWKGSRDDFGARSVAYTDIWDRIRAGLILADVEDPRVVREFERHRRYPKTLEAASERASPFLYLILEELDQRKMPTDLALLPFVESAFQTHAISHGAASGLWQIVPGTGRRFGLAQNWWYDGRRDVQAATVAALTYLQYLHGLFDGDWLLALAAYNAGEGNVTRAIRRNRKAGRPTDFWHLDLPRETRHYVPRLLAVSQIVADPRKFGVRLSSIPNTPVLQSVDAGGQIDLAVAAELADMSVESLYSYNPGFNRWATPPDGPSTLLIPVDKKPKLVSGLESLPADARVRWSRYQVVRGDSLGGIAARHRTTAAVIREANNLSGNLIRAGDHLLIPAASQSLDTYPPAIALASRPIQARYRVRKGDSLWSIARRHGISYKALAKANGISARAVLKPGKQLDIPASGTGGRANGRGATQTVRYRVRQGDSLSRISRKFSISVADLRDWNGLQNSSLIRPGQVLVVHVDPTRQS